MRERWEIERSVPIGIDGNTKDAVEECNRHTLEVLLDVRELLQRSFHCPDCCYVAHGGEPSGERLRL